VREDDSTLTMIFTMCAGLPQRRCDLTSPKGARVVSSCSGEKKQLTEFLYCRNHCATQGC
jgi:hypothetical protein